MTDASDDASNGSRSQLRRRSAFNPWNRPQSTSTRPRGVETRYFEPVTVPAAPRNSIFTGLSFLSAEWNARPDVVDRARDSARKASRNCRVHLTWINLHCAAPL